MATDKKKDADWIVYVGRNGRGDPLFLSTTLGAASLAVLYNVWGEGDCGEPEGFIGAEESEDHMRDD